MKLGIKSSCKHVKEYVVALLMLSEYIKCADPTDKVACLVDNHYNGICVQKMDVNEDIENKEEVILNSFLGVTDSKSLSLIEALA